MGVECKVYGVECTVYGVGCTKLASAVVRSDQGPDCQSNWAREE